MYSKKLNCYNFLLIAFLAVALIPSVYAETISVEAGEFAISNALQTANDGDTLLLVTDGGLYKDTTVVIDKKITICADPQLVTKPVWTFLYGTADVTSELIHTYANLTVKGITFGMEADSVDNFLNAEDVSTELNKVVVEGCAFRNCNKAIEGIARTEEGQCVDSLIITNSYFQDYWDQCIRIGFSTTPVSYVKIENSTFSRDVDNVNIVINYQSSDMPVVEINHVTMDGGNVGFKFTDMVDESKTTFSNCIFTNLTKQDIMNKGGAPLVLTYSCYTGVLNGVTAGPNCITDDPMFVDAENYNYTLQEGSPCIGTASDGTNMGDLNWEDGGSTSVKSQGNAMPTEFSLSQNYPNPFNPQTSIQFSIPTASNVKLTVFNTIGQEVAILLNEQKNPGSYTLNFDASGLPGGLYFCRLEAGSYVNMKQMVYLK